jgi:predicted nucleotidyltransferase
MISHIDKSLRAISSRLRDALPEVIDSIRVFGSRARGDHSGMSDIDILIVVKRKTPSIEDRIISIIVNEEARYGLSLTPVIKDVAAFEKEKNFNTPFFENIMKEGILL